ncbi:MULTISPECIES: hypothetical protein [Mesorhizobium]
MSQRLGAPPEVALLPGATYRAVFLLQGVDEPTSPTEYTRDITAYLYGRT